MGVLASSYIPTVDLKRPRCKTNFCVLSDTLLGIVYFSLSNSKIKSRLWPAYPTSHGWLNAQCAHVNCALSLLDKGWQECPKRFPGPLWPRTIPSNILPPEWTFNFSNYQSTAFCHSPAICFNFCRINLTTILRRWVTKTKRYPWADLKNTF